MSLRLSHTVKHVTTSFILRVNTPYNLLSRKEKGGDRGGSRDDKKEREERSVVRNPSTGPGRTVTMTHFQKRHKETVTGVFKDMFQSEEN